MQVRTNPALVGNSQQFTSAPYPKKRFYTPADLKPHNTANDCWISFFNRVLDLSSLIQASIASPLCKPLIDAAGSDISYWFDAKTREPRKQVDLQTGQEVYYCPLGQFLHIPPSGPSSKQEPTNPQIPWWRNPDYQIGILTYKTRKIKIVNMLTAHEDILEVPMEETINEILERYKTINFHAASYAWKRMGVPLDMEKNLEQNGIQDETEEFDALDIPETEWYIPAVHLYFKDDLTVA